eukprot:UN03332
MAANVVDQNSSYLRKIEELREQLGQHDIELGEARKQLKTLQSDLNFGESLDDIEREIVRNARVRKSLGMPITKEDDVVLESINEALNMSNSTDEDAGVPELNEN